LETKKEFRSKPAGFHCPQKVVHRDIKLNNIMVDDELNVKLIDFGLSREFNQQKLDTHCGTPVYAAPELFDPSPYSGPGMQRAGACGSVPFWTDTRREVA
jgi:serine/threonine protein kinase